MTSLLPFSLRGRFYKGNLHTHTDRSDGCLEQGQVCSRYRNAGYDFLVLSDHFMERFGYPVTNGTSCHSRHFITLPGAELHTPGTDLGDLWHILAVGLPPDFPPPAKEETGPALAQRAQAAGAFVALSHPERNSLSLESGQIMAPCIHAVEIYNHHSSVRSDRGGGWYFLDALSNEGHHLSAIAVDDSHNQENDSLGGWVMVKAESLASEALLHALKAGHFYSSQGPELHTVGVTSDRVNVHCSPVSRIILLGRGACSAVAEGERITTAQLALSGFGKSPWVRVVVIDDKNRHAWTNPIWL